MNSSCLKIRCHKILGSIATSALIPPVIENCDLLDWRVFVYHKSNLRSSELDYVISISYPAEIFSYHGEHPWQVHDTENSNDNGYDTERTE